MDCKRVTTYIVNWLGKKLTGSYQKGFVIGVSGGIDSAVVSTLCSKTSHPVIILNMPIHPVKDHYNMSNEQIEWLLFKFKNVTSFTIDLTSVFKEFKSLMPNEANGELALVNTRSRLRMITLYSFSNTNNYLVCGTGNKIEDYGIGFFTKYGDGGVDINPIGDLLKSEVYKLAAHLEIPTSIQNAPPADGLWDIYRTDEDQIGATYDELEWTLEYCENNKMSNLSDIKRNKNLSERQTEVLKIYIERHNSNKHKMEMPPVCDLSTVK